jgi:putative transposase
MSTSKDRTPSFIATIRLKTEKKAEKQFLVMSDCARQLYNACLGESLKRLRGIQSTELYKRRFNYLKLRKRILKNVERTSNI